MQVSETLTDFVYFLLREVVMGFEDICLNIEALDIPVNKRKGIPLYSHDEVPHFLKGNPYIHSGYRAFLSSGQCIASLCIWSNETLNVWTHLLGFFIFLFLTFYDNVFIIPVYQGTASDHMVYTLCLICFQFCMLCSAGYHLFCAQNEEVCTSWLALDHGGICIGLMGCYFPGLYYAFYCFKVWRSFYLTIVCLFIFFTLYVQTNKRFLTNSWANCRLVLFCSLVGYGVIPVTHWMFLNGGFSSGFVQTFLPKVVVMYGLGFLALGFYITKIPERCFPGRVDFIGSSHQLWHIIVVMAFLWWHRAGVEMMGYRHSNVCSAEELPNDLLAAR